LIRFRWWLMMMYTMRVFLDKCSCVVCSMQDALRSWSVGPPPSGHSDKQ
jgi:hypothetical protein